MLYIADSRKLYKVGISFSSETGTINDFGYCSVTSTSLLPVENLCDKIRLIIWQIQIESLLLRTEQK